MKHLFSTIALYLIAQPALCSVAIAQTTGAQGPTTRAATTQSTGLQALATPASFASHAQEVLDSTVKPDAILGEWWTERKEGRVKIVKDSRDLYEVILLDGKDADKPDVENPDAKLRGRKLRGILLMWGLRFDGEEYVDGRCYNPRDGETYRVKMRVTGPTTLTLRGYLGIPLLGQSQEWTRSN